MSDYTGPVVPFVLSVPSASTQVSISAEAAHIVFGNGGKRPAPAAASRTRRRGPTRPTTSSATATPARRCSRRISSTCPRPSSGASTASRRTTCATRCWRRRRRSSRSAFCRSIMPTRTAATCAACICSRRVRSAGFLPDTNKNSFDKMNVRDGHYPLWGYVHFFTPIGPGGVPSDAAKAMVTRFSVRAPRPGAASTTSSARRWFRSAR